MAMAIMTTEREVVDAFNRSVREYTKHTFEIFRKQLQNGGGHFNGGFNVCWMSNRTKWDAKKGVWNYNPSFNCEPCQELFEKVIALHRKTDKIGFENCKKKRVAGCWGIAKLFMPRNSQDIESPEDTDIFTILQMMSNCILFMTLEDHDVFEIFVRLNPIYGYFENSHHRIELFTFMATCLQSLIQDIQDVAIRDNLRRAVSKIKKSTAGLQSADGPPDLITPCTFIRAIEQILGFIPGIVTGHRLILHGLRPHVFALLYFIS
ncbi:uncharacterized protein LOC123562205 [Mercenaria mercenaria]|uniref:uncharacterized protein LOC123562205 n=1 Tax=Mercenaria mercenaria TaxID=6596 RepID=UPI00234E4465|nr:uncharacterized protein LOC123562205 [Mercenaria mercenaria]